MRAGVEGKGKRLACDLSNPPCLETSRAERQDGSNQLMELEDGEGERGDLPGSIPTLEDLQLKEVYGDWVHAKPGTHLHGGITDDEAWKGWWRDLTDIPSWRYDTPSGKAGRHFVVALVEELRGVRDRLWNLDWFIIFQTVILKRSRHVTASYTTRRMIEKRLDAWEAGRQGMLIEETLRTCAQYLTAAHREDHKEHREKNYHILVLRGNLRKAVRWITEREMGGVLQLEEVCTKNRGEGDEGTLHQTPGNTLPVRVQSGHVSRPITRALPRGHHQRHSGGAGGTTIWRSRDGGDGISDPPALAPMFWSGERGVAYDSSGLYGVAR